MEIPNRDYPFLPHILYKFVILLSNQVKSLETFHGNLIKNQAPFFLPPSINLLPLILMVLLISLNSAIFHQRKSTPETGRHSTTLHLAPFKLVLVSRKPRLQDIADTFEGNFKEQSGLNSNWLPVNPSKVSVPPRHDTALTYLYILCCSMLNSMLLDTLFPLKLHPAS